VSSVTHTLVELIEEGAAQLEVPIDSDVSAALCELMLLLQRWNQRIRLVGKDDVETLVDVHVHDSLGLLRLLDRPEIAQEGVRWCDVGAGAGLPGLVLAIARPDLALHLVEPVGKKMAFIKRAISVLGLNNVSTEQTRIETMTGAGTLRAAMSRATFSPLAWRERATELLCPGGRFIVMMGRDVPDLIREEASALDCFSLPISGSQRVNAMLHTGGDADALKR